MAAILTLRRGTSTPSLAQSELFFNTSTETLNVGGTSTITLVKLGSNTGNITLTGNLSINGGISGSTLDITGNAKIDGNVLIGGNIVLGTGSNDTITVNAPFTGSLIPQEDGIDSLGSTSKRFKSLHVVSASIDNISLPGSGILSSSNENFTIFSQSVDSRLDNLQLDSQSQDSRLDSLESFTSSQASNNNDIIELFATASIHEVRIDNLSSLTSSYATTGSNVFRGNQTISGSINVSGSTTILGGVSANIFMNPQTLTADVVVPDNTNALLLGPVNIGGSVSLGISSSLLVLPEDFTSFASTGSNQFRGNQHITGSIIPEGSGSHDLGSLTNPFRDLYLSSASLRLVKDGQILSELSANQSNLTISSSTTYFTRNVNVSGSVTAQLFSGSFSGSFSGTLPSQDGRLNSLEQKSASVDISVSQLNQYTSSLKTAISVNGSNLTVNGDLMVLGTTTQIDSTQVNIGENIIELNYGGALTKGGFYVKDATGNFTSGSMLWDSTIDRWIAGPSGSESVVLLRGGDSIVSSSAQITSSLDFRYLEINGDNVFTGSSQITITDTSGFTTFSGSLKSTDDGQDSRLNNLQLTSQSHHNRISQLESDSGSQGGRISSLEGFTSSQQTLNGFYNSYTSSNNNRVNNLEGFTSSIDSTIKNKINLEGVVSSSSNTSTISLSIQSGVISGSVIGGVVSGSSQLTSSLNTLYEVSGSVAQLVGIYQVSGSLGSAAWYNVSSSISDGNPQVLGNAGAVKDYIDSALIAVGAGDITAVVAGVGMSGGAASGPATLSLDTSSAHFVNGTNSVITPFSSSVSASIASLASSSGHINYVTNSIEQLTGIEVADFDNNVAVTFVGGTLKFIFGTPAVPSSIAASLSGFLTDRFNRVNDEYIINGTWTNGGYTLISASLYEDSTLLNQVGGGTSVSFTTTTSGSHTYRLELTGSSPLDGSIFTSSTTTTGTISKSNPVSPTLTPSVTVQLGASSNQIEQGATGSISFTSSSANPSNGWDLIEVTTNVSTPYLITGSATGSSSISIIASASYESPIGDNNPDLTIITTTTQTYTKIRSLRHGASTSASFTAGELENISTWDTTLGGGIGTIVKGTTNPSGQSVTISWTGDKYHYIVFNSSLSNLSNITTSGFGVLGQFSVTTVGQYKVYKTNTLQAGGAGSSITYTLT